MSEDFKKRILEIPEDGEFYKPSTEEYFIKSAEMLLKKGFSEDEIIEFLEGFYTTVSEEYGN